ncbi:MAG TPA: CpsB/CapC family capsule biosynthesis tyrosine phosphatase [Thermoanaerobaculia bacterium]|nr:CpsB/CapC family capsule biosynthesis tyrosine phosphatase [Thermoanaerobaculia bacterium]
MIDLHFHCLPGIDDGPRTWDEAVALCREAASQGTTTLVATPHVLRDDWINDDPAVRDDMLFELNTRLEGLPVVLAGCEYLFSSNVLQLLERGEWSPLTLLHRSRYLLIEFRTPVLPPDAESIFHELSLLDVTPVVAHPERHPVFAADPVRLERLVALGAVAQLTAGSLLGDFGSSARAACDRFFGLGLAHLVASDAHSLERRPPRLAQARERARLEWGEEAAKGLFQTNPEALLRSEPLPWRSEPAEKS